jgi:two-component system response regulator YesN
MYTVALIEDEKMVLRSLRATLDWEALGFTIIGEAYNGAEGVEMLEALRPDIALTDVRMPALSGLEMMAEAHRRKLDTLFIVVSGYAEFAYVQKAINQGAIGYCLKPFSASELTEVLGHASDMLRGRRDGLIIDLMAYMDSPLPNAELFWADMLRGSGLTQEQVYPAVLIGEPGSSRGLCRPVQIGRGKYFTLLQRDALRPADLPQNMVSLGIGRPLTVYRDVWEAVEEAERMALQYFVTGKLGQVWRCDQMNNVDFTRFFARVTGEPLSALPELLEEARRNMQTGAFDIRYCARLLMLVLERAHGEVPAGIESGASAYGALTAVFANADSLLAYLRFAVQESEAEQTEPPRSESLHPVVEYVENNFTQSISVQDLSRKFSFNPSYVSQLFRRELGMTFTEYITGLRCRYACRLLQTTSLTLGEIAEKVGYNDYFYFIRVFKKTLGKTPTQYRSENAQ